MFQVILQKRKYLSGLFNMDKKLEVTTKELYIKFELKYDLKYRIEDIPYTQFEAENFEHNKRVVWKRYESRFDIKRNNINVKNY